MVNPPNRVRKSEIKFKTELTEEQKLVKASIYEKDISIILGNFGSGKTHLACNVALDMLFKKQINKIFITRPINFEATGYLKGPQPLYSKVLTPYGWSTIGDLKVGDEVIASNGLVSKVIGKSELNTEPIYRVTTTDGRSMLCSIYHLFHTLIFNDKKHRLDYPNTHKGSVKTLEEIINTLLDNRGRINHYLPYNKPVEFLDVKSHFIHPYLMGVLLGDGYLGSSVGFTNLDNELIEKCRNICEKLNLHLTNSNNQIHYSIHGRVLNNKPSKSIILTNVITNEVEIFTKRHECVKKYNIDPGTLNTRCLKNIIKDNIHYSFGEKESDSTNVLINELIRLKLRHKKALDKFIPKEFIYNSSVEDRVELLRGLMDTDGTNDGKAGAFTTISKQLALDIQELVWSLGGRAVIYTRDRIGNSTIRKGDNKNITTKHISYEVCLNLDFNPFYISRKAIKYSPKYKHLIGIKSIERLENDVVQCIKIDNEEGLYITNDYIVTHNSIEEKMSFHVFPIKQNMYDAYGKERIDELFKDGVIQIIPIDYMKGITVSNGFMIVDEFQDIKYEDFELIVTRLGVDSKLVFTGSEQQIGIAHSCINKIKCLEHCPTVNFATLQSFHRNPDIIKVLNFIKENNK